MFPKPPLGLLALHHTNEGGGVPQPPGFGQHEDLLVSLCKGQPWVAASRSAHATAWGYSWGGSSGEKHPQAVLFIREAVQAEVQDIVLILSILLTPTVSRSGF